MLILSAIQHFVRITLFIVSMPPPGSSTEHLFSYDEDKVKTATAKVGGITQT